MPLRHGLSKLSRSPSAIWLERVLYSPSKVLRSPFKVATALIERWAVGETTQYLLNMFEAEKLPGCGVCGIIALQISHKGSNLGTLRKDTLHVFAKDIFGPVGLTQTFINQKLRSAYIERTGVGLVRKLSKHHPQRIVGIFVGKKYRHS